MGIKICGAPCCWGVDDITNPNLPTYQRVMSEAHEAGYRAIELGPNGWIPTDDIEGVTKLLNDNQLAIVAGTIFDDCLSDENYEKLLAQAEGICQLITKLPPLPREEGQRWPTPYMTVMDWDMMNVTMQQAILTVLPGWMTPAGLSLFPISRDCVKWQISTVSVRYCILIAAVTSNLPMKLIALLRKSPMTSQALYWIPVIWHMQVWIRLNG